MRLQPPLQPLEDTRNGGNPDIPPTHPPAVTFHGRRILFESLTRTPPPRIRFHVRVVQSKRVRTGRLRLLQPDSATSARGQRWDGVITKTAFSFYKKHFCVESEIYVMYENADMMTRSRIHHHQKTYIIYLYLFLCMYIYAYICIYV